VLRLVCRKAEANAFGGGNELGDARTNFRAIESDDMKGIVVTLSWCRFHILQNIP
jgi:hypothetical protein